MTFLEKMTDKELASIKRLGYFLGSFDPLHLGHIEVVRVILDKKLCDAVFVYCVQGKSFWKQRSDFFQRTRFCEYKFCNMNNNVILSYLSPQEIQQKLTIRKKNRVKSKFFQITGIIGADIACNLENKNENPSMEKLRQARQVDFMQGIFLDTNFNDSIACSISLPADDFIIALRKDYKIEDIPNVVCKRKVRALIDTNKYRHLASSEIKRCGINLNNV